MKRSRKTLQSQFCKNTLLSNVHLLQHQFEAKRHLQPPMCLSISDSFSTQGAAELTYIGLSQESDEYINSLLRQRTPELFWVTPKDAKL